MNKKKDINVYKNDFIDKFLNVFPTIYTETELKSILDNNVKSIEQTDELEKNCFGNYCYKEKHINYKIENDEILFHEFVHSIRGNEKIEEADDIVTDKEFSINSINGVIEGCTKYAEMLFMYSKNNKYQYQYLINMNYLYFKDIDTINKSSYFPLFNVMEKLDIIYSSVNKHQTILECFLKRGNVYKCIYEIYLNYFMCLKERENNIIDNNELKLQAMRTAYNLINNINEMFISIKDEQDIDTAVENLEFIDKSLVDIYEILCVDNKNIDMFNKLLLDKKVMTREDKLLNLIFGTDKPKEYSLKKELHNLSSSIIYRD